MDSKFNRALKRDLKILKSQIGLLNKILKDKNPDIQVSFKYGKRKMHGRIGPESLRTYIISHFIEHCEEEADLHEMSLYVPKPARIVKISGSFENWKRKQMKKDQKRLFKRMKKMSNAIITSR
jgi:hypothetical protein